MKNSILFIYLSFFFFLPLCADEVTYDTVRLAYLRDMAYRHQYPPFNISFATQLYKESMKQGNLHYKNLGAYYLASCYDKKHNPDSLAYWVNLLKEMAPKVSTYDYYLEQKAAISRALASKRMIERAIYTAKEVLEESERYYSNNGKIAAYNSLGCAYSVSSRGDKALDVFLKAYHNFTPNTKMSLKVDILSRIAQLYGSNGQDGLRMIYLKEMSKCLQETIAKEPEAKNNWSDMAIDCEVKYVLHFMDIKDYDRAAEHIERAKAMLAPHVDPVFWLNVQLIQLQYYARTEELDKSIALIDEVTPTVLNNYVNSFATLVNYKSSILKDKGDIDEAIATRRYLIQTQDSLNNAFSTSQLEEMKELYHIDELLLEKQKISNTNYKRLFLFLVILSILTLLFYIYTRYISKKITLAEQAAADAANLTKADNAAKERLKIEISHDVRTPLNAVVGFAELLAESEKLEQESKIAYGQIIQENAEQLLVYVNNILELSRLESGKIKYEHEECELIEICREAIFFAKRDGKDMVNPVLQTTIGQQLFITDRKCLVQLLQSMMVPVENDVMAYRTIIHIDRDELKSLLLFRVVDTPLAKENSENKTAVIRNEINAHFVHNFGGSYKVYIEANEYPAIAFSLRIG